MSDVIGYDIEVFKDDALIVFVDLDGHVIGRYWNNRDRVTDEDPSGFDEVRDIVQRYTLTGYNNYGYDDYIVTLMMNPATSWARIIKANNDRIIGGKGVSFKRDPNIVSLDCMQQIDVSVPSLKQIEGNLGKSIVESKVDFNINRPLTDEERKETEYYCTYDVLSAIEVYKLRKKNYFDVKDGLIAMLPADKQEAAHRWNTTTISAMILTDGHLIPTWHELHIPDDLWRNVEGIPSDVWDMWASSATEDTILEKGKSKTIRAFGCKIVFGSGGLHGAPDKPIRVGACKHKDVKSMYPSIIVALRALGSATEIYDHMRQERIKIKHTDPIRAAAYKLILNSVYGNFKNRYSALYNPFASLTVCVMGMIAIFELSRDLDRAGYQIININTDGVVYVDNKGLGDRDEEICSAWESKYAGLSLETDYYTKWIQKDVNNYIAIDNSGVLTLKGGEVNRYSTNKLFGNNNARIVQIALVEYLLNGTPVDVTLWEHRHDPLVWQYVLKAGSTYKGVQDSNGAWQQKVNRVFACKKSYPYTKLYKVRADDGLVNFADVPDRMFLWNHDINDIPDFEDMIDMSHYADIVNNKLKAWET